MRGFLVPMLESSLTLVEVAAHVALLRMWQVVWR